MVYSSLGMLLLSKAELQGAAVGLMTLLSPGDSGVGNKG